MNQVRDRSSLTSAVRVFALAYFRSVAAGLDDPINALRPAAVQAPHPLDAALGMTRQQIAAERTQRPV